MSIHSMEETMKEHEPEKTSNWHSGRQNGSRWSSIQLGENLELRWIQLSMQRRTLGMEKLGLLHFTIITIEETTEEDQLYIQFILKRKAIVWLSFTALIN